MVRVAMILGSPRHPRQGDRAVRRSPRTDKRITTGTARAPASSCTTTSPGSGRGGLQGFESASRASQRVVMEARPRFRDLEWDSRTPRAGRSNRLRAEAMFRASEPASGTASRPELRQSSEALLRTRAPGAAGASPGGAVERGGSEEPRTSGPRGPAFRPSSPSAQLAPRAAVPGFAAVIAGEYALRGPGGGCLGS